MNKEDLKLTYDGGKLHGSIFDIKIWSVNILYG